MLSDGQIHGRNIEVKACKEIVAATLVYCVRLQDLDTRDGSGGFEVFIGVPLGIANGAPSDVWWPLTRWGVDAGSLSVVLANARVFGMTRDPIAEQYPTEC
jgi:hypothetical protein